MTSAFRLDEPTVRGFVEQFLIDRYDESAPIGRVQQRMWQWACDPNPLGAMAAPRKHTKTTSINHAFGLIGALSKQYPFQIKLGSTYALACERIVQAKEELISNQRLRAVFRMRRIIRERENDIIAEMDDGYQFRMIASGMDQKVRGFSWGTMRPNLFILDDVEDDTEVLNADVRNFQMNQLLNVILPMGGDHAKYRVIGTILHQDSLLAKLLKQEGWLGISMQACDENVSEESILWKAKFPRAKLLAVKQIYINAGKLDGFNREYRNLAIDESTSFFRSEDFRPMQDDDYGKRLLYYVGGDLAISKKEKRDYTVFYVGGIDEEGYLHIVDERRGRWDGKEIIDELYSIHEAWSPEEYFIESGAIKAALGAALEIRMREEGFLNIAPGLVPTKDKAVRAMPAQARMRSRGLRWDTEAGWFADAKQELLEFSQEGTRGAHDDRVDALAWLCQGLKRMVAPLSEQDQEEEDDRMRRRERESFTMAGRNLTTGY